MNEKDQVEYEYEYHERNREIVSEERKCPTCKGTGEILSRFAYNEYTECTECWGDGVM